MMGKRRRVRSVCGDHRQELEWLASDDFLCLACGRPLPAVGSPEFNPLTVILVFQELPNGSRELIDVVHAECSGALPPGGFDMREASSLFN